MCVSGASVSGVCYDDSKSWQSFVPSVGGLRVTSVEVPVSKLETTFHLFFLKHDLAPHHNYNLTLYGWRCICLTP
jgi:hypothetical protein